MSGAYHTPVLVDKVLGYLITKPDGIYVDATVGGGGHAERILGRLSPKGKLIGFDADGDAIDHTRKHLERYGVQAVLIWENFTHLRELLGESRVFHVDGILMDLGVSSYQLDRPDRGFSFQHDERLDMRMDKRQQPDAVTLLRVASEHELESILRDFGEERRARSIARAIVQQRTSRPLETTNALAALVGRVVGGAYLRKTLARVFQAIRIAVNNELENLRNVLHQSLEILDTGGRIVVISYHSLEDRIVKEFFKGEAGQWIPSGSKLVPDVRRNPRLRILTKKPVTPARQEIRSNPRARSAKLRAAERV